MRITKYWIFQILGWILFAFLNIYVAILTHEYSIGVLMLNLALFLMGLVLSHLYRNHIIQHAWVNKPTEVLLKYVFTANVIISLLYCLGYFILFKLLMHKVLLQWHWQNIIGTFVAVFLLFAIWNAIYFSWNYIEKNRTLVINRLTMESAMKDLEIKTIKANLQPHFIFNALNSIRALIDENPKMAREAVTKVSNILRNSITQKNETNSLKNEINLVEDYLDLEKIRFEERLHFTKNIDPQTESIQIPTMMLQTLVENAVKHGISALEVGGIIVLQSVLLNQTLTISIKNSGTLSKKTNPEKGLSFGIASTIERLKYLYQDKAHFEIKQENEFVITTITIKQ